MSQKPQYDALRDDLDKRLGPLWKTERDIFTIIYRVLLVTTCYHTRFVMPTATHIRLLERCDDPDDTGMEFYGVKDADGTHYDGDDDNGPAQLVDSDDYVEWCQDINAKWLRDDEDVFKMDAGLTRHSQMCGWLDIAATLKKYAALVEQLPDLNNADAVKAWLEREIL